MTEQVISYRRPRRKRGEGWTRLGALVVTAAALAVATWLAPYVYRPALPDMEPVKAAAPAPVKRPRDAAKDIVTESAPAPAPPVTEARRPPRRARPAPEDTPAHDPGEGVEVLSAAELDAISQAGH